MDGWILDFLAALIAHYHTSLIPDANTSASALETFHGFHRCQAKLHAREARVLLR